MKPDIIVGPGDYELGQNGIGNGAPKWTMTRRHSMTEKIKNPPVGLYEVDRSYNKTQTH